MIGSNGSRWSAEPADDCIQAWSELLFQFCRQLGFNLAGLTDRRPVDMAIQERWRFPVDNQTDNVRSDTVNYPPGRDRSDAWLSEFGYLSFKMT